VIFGLALLATAWYIGSKFKFAGLQKSENAEVILEKVKSVCKLVTAEGYISEVYDYKDYYHFDFKPFRKKAIIRVKAKVSVGYDLEKIEMHADELTKTILLSNLPGVDIISIDHDLDYYDISEGTFNSFDEDDYDELNRNAKDFVRQIALDSDIVQMAENKSNELFEIIRFMVEQAGWQLEIKRNTPDNNAIEGIFN
jgi:hypothetical protein